MATIEDTTKLANAFHDYVTMQYGVDRVTKTDMVDFLYQTSFTTGDSPSMFSSASDDDGYRFSACSPIDGTSITFQSCQLYHKEVS